VESEWTSHNYKPLSHLSAKNHQIWWKFDKVLTNTILLSFLGHGV